MFDCSQRAAASVISVSRSEGRGRVNIEAKYFAAFREQAGCATERVTTNAVTVADLYGEIADRHGFADSIARCKVAVNDELTVWDAPLSDGDTVLFFPPVAGG
jgi:molybdopterin converting factor subunit 1